MKSTRPVSESQKTIADFLERVVAPEGIVEIRALGVPHGHRGATVAGYFDRTHIADAAAAADDLSAAGAAGVYWSLNPPLPALLARAPNRVAPADRGGTTSDKEIVCRRFLAVDLDPERPAGIPSSDAEHAAAVELARRIVRELGAEGWPAPIAVDTGNGALLLYRIDLPTDDGGAVKRILEALAARFDGAGVHVDRTLYNPARIVRLPGTMNRKGGGTPDRPHRFAVALHVPEALVLVPAEILEAFAGAKPDAGPRASESAFDLEAWIQKHNLDVEPAVPWEGGRKWVFRVCPWDPAHTNRSAVLLQQANGAIAARCLHNGCTGKGWSDLREMYEPWRRGMSGAAPSAGEGETPPWERVEVEEEETPVPERPWPELAEEAAYGLADAVVGMLLDRTEADRAALLATFLTLFGNAVGRGPHILIEDTEHRGNLFDILVGSSSSGRKGTGSARIVRAFDDADPEYTKFRVAPGGLSSAEGVIHAVRDPVMKMVKDPRSGILHEQLVDPGVPDKRLCVIEPEFASVLSVMRRTGNCLSTLLRVAWDGGALRPMVKNAPEHATGAHISICAHITQEELLQHATAADVASGFLNRFLIVCVRRSKLLPFSVPFSEKERELMTGAIKAALARARGLDLVTLDSAAEDLWAASYPALNVERPGYLGHMTKRGAPQVLRLALINACLDGVDRIRAAHLKAALALWRYAEASVEYVFETRTGDEMADVIHGELLRRPAGLARSAIWELLGRNVSKAKMDAALRFLERSGLAHRTRAAAGPGPGRPLETWKAGRAS